MKKDRKRTILFVIILLVLSLGIGYAFLTTTLTIDGVSDIDSANWDIHFDNVQVQSGSVTGTQVITPATISADGQTVSYHVKLKEPGDGYVFKIDIVNDGTLDAMIDNLIYKVNDEYSTMPPSYIAEYALYDDNSMINIGDVLEAGDTKTLLVGIYYREDINPNDLPATDESLNIDFKIVYSQAGKPSYVYSVGYAQLLNGESLPDNVTTYSNYTDAVNAFGHDIFVRLQIRNDRVTQKAVGFIYGGNVHYITGGDSGSSYEQNIEILTPIFGSSNCHFTEPGPLYQCSSQGVMHASTYSYGNAVVVDNAVYGCEVSDTFFDCGDLGF